LDGSRIGFNHLTKLGQLVVLDRPALHTKRSQVTPELVRGKPPFSCDRHFQGFPQDLTWG
jgi:hypothetical protein